MHACMHVCMYVGKHVQGYICTLSNIHECGKQNWLDIGSKKGLKNC